LSHLSSASYTLRKPRIYLTDVTVCPSVGSIPTRHHRVCCDGEDFCPPPCSGRCLWESSMRVASMW
jgi:hypothetical protein